MIARNAALARASELMRKRQFREAEALLRPLMQPAAFDPDVAHLLGLIRKENGDAQEGERLIRASIAAAPERAEFRANLGNLLYRLNRFSEAQREYREALRLQPQQPAARLGLARALIALSQFEQAEVECRSLIGQGHGDAAVWSTLGSALRDQGQQNAAESALRNAVRANPSYGAAYHNLGALLSSMERPEEAIEQLRCAERLGVQGFEIAFNRARALFQLYRFDEAEQAFERAVQLRPQHAGAQMNLAKLRFMRADPEFTRGIVRAVESHPDNLELKILLGDVLRSAGDLPSAEAVLRNLLQATWGAPQSHSALALVLLESGQLEEAEDHARAAVEADSDKPQLVENLVSIQLGRGKAEAALKLIERQRALHPLDQRWLAHQASAARLLGLPLYRELYDYDRFVQVFELDAFVQHCSIDELNAELLALLNERHRFSVHPLDQSLRHGSQTARSLLTENNPVMKSLLEGFDRAVQAYRAVIGCSPTHPLTARNQGKSVLKGCWSVRLVREGFHVNHIHPEGWISSAYYVHTPAEVEDPSRRSGWLKFGEPRFAIPGATPESFVQPKPGRLVLFPSYMWHGTTPILGDEPRVTVAFDALPKLSG